MVVYEILLFIGGVMISFYATHQAVILLARRPADWMEAVAGAGGILYLFGVYIAGFSAFDPHFLIAFSLQSLGVGLLLLPRIVRIVRSSMAAADC